jgi:ribonuclease D
VSSPAVAPTQELPVEMIVDDARLAALVDTLRDEPLYAVDTEFHREKTYFPKVALVQIAWPTGIALVDPLAVNLEPLAVILDGPGCAVLHAAQQDLEVMARSCGTSIPRSQPGFWAMPRRPW